MKILLTGASGFLGRALVQKLSDQNVMFVLSLALRSRSTTSALTTHIVGEFFESTDWAPAVAEQQVVIHAAARAHILNEEAVNPLAEYRRVNVEGTLRLAQQAAAAGVKRFIFISSIGVNGNINTRPFRADDQSNPAEPYAQSKWEAEQGLRQLAADMGMEVVIIRPPLVYGPSAPGNFGTLVRWIEKGIPLPLGAVHNRRSLVGIDNLVDLIVRCIDHPAAANQLFLASDGEDISTTDLLRGVGDAMGRPARLIPVPPRILQLSAAVLGKNAMAQRLLGSLQVDISKTRELLHWTPPYTLEQGLRRCFDQSN